MKSYVLKVDGSRLEANPKDGNSFSLEEIKSLINVDYIEILYLKDRIMVLDEEGKLNNKQVNKEATVLYTNYFGPYDYIVGDVLICPINFIN